MWFILVCIISLVCIPFANSASAETYEPAKAPKINSFTASPTTIATNGTSTLSWDVSNATKVDIKGVRVEEGEDLPLSGSIEVWPEQTTTYVLVATGPGGEASQSVTVNVGSTTIKAKVESFTASATEVVKGNSIWLTWKTSNAKTVTIIGIKSDEALDLNGTIEIWPEQTTTYLIQAIGVNGDIDSKSITVNVIESVNPVINSFTASATEITSGEKVQLSWDVANAKSIAIKDVQSGLAAKGSLAVSPTKTTTYVLEVIGTNGKIITKSIIITVKTKNPIINSFTASSTVISSGELVTLTWSTTNAAGCMILTSDGSILTDRPASGKISVTPFTTKTYTLVAYNADKSITAEKSITITVK